MSEIARMPGAPEPRATEPDAGDDLAAVDPDAPVDAGPIDPAAARRAAPPRKRPMAAAMLAGAMVGLQEALFDKPKDEPVIVEASGADNDDDDVLAVDLDPYDPSASIAVVRPWLQK